MSDRPRGHGMFLAKDRNGNLKVPLTGMSEAVLVMSPFEMENV